MTTCKSALQLFRIFLGLVTLAVWPVVRAQEASAPANNAYPVFELARECQATHVFSTLFTAQDMRRYLNSEQGLAQAIDWCKKTGVTRVFLETFRDGLQVEGTAMKQAQTAFLQAGIKVSGCITPTRVGKSSTGWKDTISCYTDKPTQQKLKNIFADTAALFDEIMIDDFWFTDCACTECDQARQARQVVIGAQTYAVTGDAWENYRCELMTRLSQDYVLKAAKSVNPKASIIIKYPQWYDRFHERGYEVIRETADFDTIWVGTETRDYGNQQWGGTVQYEAYFIMRWLGGIGGGKCGGGWYDWLGTTERTYLEQARQTILAGARESMLFCYGGLQRDTGPRNIELLRTHIPELLAVAKQARPRSVLGIAAYKPANSHPEEEARVFDFVGMLGLPLAPCHEFPAQAPAAFFSIHALKDADLVANLGRFLQTGRPVLITDGLAMRLQNQLDLQRSNVQILAVNRDPKSLLQLTQPVLDTLRETMLKPLRSSFKAPNQVALYLFTDGSWVVENFNPQPVTVELNSHPITVNARGWTYEWQ